MTGAKKLASIALAMVCALSLLTACGSGGSAPTPPSSGNVDPCPCCPNCIQEECECAECGDSDGCKCSLPDTQYDWRIYGEGEQPFTIPGMIGTNKMIIKLDLVKLGGATPAGTYTGTLYFWHYEMTPEMMQSVGATGDSYNEFESDIFTVDISEAQGSEWLYRTQDVSITITSVTDVTVYGQKQQVTDYPSQNVRLAFDINLATGEVQMAFTLGNLEPLVFEGFQIEQSKRN